MSKTIIAVRHFGLGGRESLETAVILYVRILCFCNVWTEKKNVYRKTGNGIAFAGKQRYVDTAICVQPLSANIFASFFTFATRRLPFETRRLPL